MGTNFPHGAASFGMTQFVGGPLWLPPNANVYFVDQNLGIDGNPGTTPDAAFKTIQAAADAVANAKRKGASSQAQYYGDYVLIAPGNYIENPIFYNNYVTILGAGRGVTNIKPADATTKLSINLMDGTAITNIGLSLCGRGIRVAGLSILGGSGSLGLYVGDGGRLGGLSSLTNPVTVPTGGFGASKCDIAGIDIDGQDWGGSWGVCFDGFGEGVWLHHSGLYRWVKGGLIVQGGANRLTLGHRVWWNDFDENRGYGILRPNGQPVGGGIYGPLNTFMDDASGNAMTQAISLGTGAAKPDGITGNNFLCANPFSAQSTDWQSGNTKNVAGNTASYISQA